MAAQLPLVPDVATTARDVLLVAIVLPLLVQWWSTYYPEAEPGGGGWVVQRMVSSPGTGKTAFLKQTLSRLAARGEACAAVVGDLETDNDARRLAESGVPVRQINTHGLCHLEADMVAKHLEGWNLAGLRYLFIDNVGNLVCPTSWDLGESVRLALLSVTEGEDKPLKYPGQG